MDDTDPFRLGHLLDRLEQALALTADLVKRRHHALQFDETVQAGKEGRMKVGRSVSDPDQQAEIVRLSTIKS